MASGGREDNDFAKQMKNLLNSKFTQNSFEEQNKDQFHTGSYRPYGVTSEWEDGHKVDVHGCWVTVIYFWVCQTWNWKKEHLGLEDEITSYLSEKMEEPSEEKKKRDNEEYYEEIEGRDSRTVQTRALPCQDNLLIIYIPWCSQKLT